MAKKKLYKVTVELEAETTIEIEAAHEDEAMELAAGLDLIDYLSMGPLSYSNVDPVSAEEKT